MMTKANALRPRLSLKRGASTKSLSNEEAEVENTVEALMHEARVLGIGGDVYGLKWRYGSADEPRILVGGWLFQVSKDILLKKKSKGKLAFFILDDANGMLRQCKDETGTYSYRNIEFRDIAAVRADFDKASESVYLRLSPKKGSDWLMTPIQSTNDDIVARWVAALRHRAGLFSDAVRKEAAAAERIALWMQSLVRMRQAIERAERRRERRAGFLNKLSGMVYGYDDSESEAESEEELDSESDMRGQSDSSFLVTFVSALAADMYDNTFGVVDPKPASAGAKAKRSSKLFKHRSLFKPKQPAGAVSATAPADELVRSESYVQDSFGTVAPLQPFELEDELWENERWQLKQGWSTTSLLPTDRAAFTDRLGRGNWQSLDQYDTPQGWKVTADWQLDLSGQVSGRCGTDGYTYAIDFPPLDADLARGTPRISKGVRTMVRHRRYFRRRVPERTPRAESFVVWHGWLGRKNASTGRWHNRYFVLTRGLRLHGKVTGVALSYFRAEFTDHLAIVGSNDLEAWNALTSRHLRTFNLDGALVRDVAVRSGTSRRPAKPLCFEVRVASVDRPSLILSADSAICKDNWMGAVQHAVKDQINRFTLTKSLDLGRTGQFNEIAQYDNSVLDRLLPISVDEAFDLLFFNKDFDAEFVRLCQFKLEELERWSQQKSKGSRRKAIYTNRKRQHQIFKHKVVHAEPGEGYQVDMSIQSPQAAWGNIYQDEIRIVLSNWKDKYARLCITHRVQLRSEDETVRTFVESNARRLVLELFTERWLPLVTRTLRERRRKQAEVSKPKALSSPSGINYRVDHFARTIHAPGYSY